MDTSSMIHALMGLGVTGFFVAAWFRYSKPVYLRSPRQHRATPRLPETVGEAPSLGFETARRAPRV